MEKLGNRKWRWMIDDAENERFVYEVLDTLYTLGASMAFFSLNDKVLTVVM